MQIRFSRHHKWNKAVAEAQALVAFPPSPVDMMQALGANNALMTANIKKLMASDHPVWNTSEALFERNIQKRTGIRKILYGRAYRVIAAGR